MSGICVSINTLNVERQRIYSTWQRLQAVWALERAEELLIATVSHRPSQLPWASVFEDP